MSVISPPDQGGSDDNRSENTKPKPINGMGWGGRKLWVTVEVVVAAVAGYEFSKTTQPGNTMDPQAACNDALGTIHDLYAQYLQRELSVGGVPVPVDTITKFVGNPQNPTADAYNASISALTCSTAITFKVGAYCSYLRSSQAPEPGNATAALCMSSIINAQMGKSADTTSRVRFSIKPSNGRAYVQLIDVR